MITEGPDAGRVGWIPPVSVDPERKPRVNRAQHVNETLAAAWEKVLADRQDSLAQHRQELNRHHGNGNDAPEPEPGPDVEPDSVNPDRIE